MLFNLDKSAKQKILDYYKKESIKRLNKENLVKKIAEEDQIFLDEMEKIEKQTLNNINDEYQLNRNKLQREYDSILTKAKNHFKNSKKNYPITLKSVQDGIYKNNNDDYSENEDQLILPIVKNNSKNSYLLKEFSQNNFNDLTIKEKEKILMKPVDHMKDYLTDRENLDELKQYYKIRKQNKHNFYRDIFYNQYVNIKNKNIKLYGTNDELILKQRKKKFLSDDPYKINKGKYYNNLSLLERNPILEPKNNISYNKYIDKSLNLNSNLYINPNENIEEFLDNLRKNNIKNNFYNNRYSMANNDFNNFTNNFCNNKNNCYNNIILNDENRLFNYKLRNNKSYVHKSNHIRKFLFK